MAFSPDPYLIKLQEQIDSLKIQSAKEADIAVCQLLNDCGLSIHSAAYEELSDALCEVAGQAFPGEWDEEQPSTTEKHNGPY